MAHAGIKPDRPGWAIPPKAVPAGAEPQSARGCNGEASGVGQVGVGEGRGFVAVALLSGSVAVGALPDAVVQRFAW